MPGIDIDEVRRLNAHPGETLAVTLQRGASPEVKRQIRETLIRYLPKGVEVIVLNHGIELSVVSSAPTSTCP